MKTEFERMLEEFNENMKTLEEYKCIKEKVCHICGKYIADEKLKLTKDDKVSCMSHFRLGEDGWKLYIDI